MKRTSFLILSLLLVACSNTKTITSFEECVAAGNPILEIYPEQCRANGETFINSEQQVEPAVPMQLTVSTYDPQVNELQLIGYAPGTWFFEASLPIVIKDALGNVLLESYVQTEGDWMTTDSVVFNRLVPIELQLSQSYFIEFQKTSMEDGSIQASQTFEIQI